MSTVAPPFVQNGCLYLDDQSPCGPDYYGYPVATQPLSGLAFTDYASFNSFVKARFDEPTIEAAIHNAYGCSATPTFDLADAINSMRFQITYYCANLVAVALSSQQCSLLPVASTTQYPLGPLVCQSSCDLSSASYSRILLNSDVCTNQTAATARSVSFANECTTIASLLPNNNNYCLDGVSGSPNEKLYCGYRSKELALAHCPEVTDSCCVNFLAANPSTSSSSSANGQSTGAANTASSSATTSSSGAAASGSATGLSTSNSSSSSGVNMVIIIPIVVVVAALIIIGVISFFIYSKRRRTAPAPPIDLKVYPSSLAGNRGVNQYGSTTKLKDDAGYGGAYPSAGNQNFGFNGQSSNNGFGHNGYNSNGGYHNGGFNNGGFSGGNGSFGGNGFNGGSAAFGAAGSSTVMTDYSQFPPARAPTSQPTSAHSGSYSSQPQLNYAPSTPLSLGPPTPQQQFGQQSLAPQQYTTQPSHQQQQHQYTTAAATSTGLSQSQGQSYSSPAAPAPATSFGVHSTFGNRTANGGTAPPSNAVPSYETAVATSTAGQSAPRRSSIEKPPILSPSSTKYSTTYSAAYSSMYGAPSQQQQQQSPQRSPATGSVSATAAMSPGGPGAQPTAPSPTPSSSIAPSISSSTASAPLVMRVLHPYAPTLPDELELIVGQEVVVLRAFDDGWGLGTTPANGAQGAFPLVCVTSGVGSETGSVVSEALSNLTSEEREKQNRLSAMIQKGAKRESAIVR